MSVPWEPGVGSGWGNDPERVLKELGATLPINKRRKNLSEQSLFKEKALKLVPVFLKASKHAILLNSAPFKAVDSIAHFLKRCPIMNNKPLLKERYHMSCDRPPSMARRHPPPAVWPPTRHLLAGRPPAARRPPPRRPAEESMAQVRGFAF